jgi:hypothetical protein
MPKPKFRPKASGQVGFSAIGLQLSPGDRDARDPAPTFAGNGRWQLPTGEKSFLAWFGSGARRAVQAEQGGAPAPCNRGPPGKSNAGCRRRARRGRG